MRVLIINIILICGLSLTSFSQSAFSVKLVGLGIHLNPQKQESRIYENKITEAGSLVIEPGYEISFQKFISLTRLSVEVRQGFHSDAAAKQAGHLALGLRWKFFHYGRHTFSSALSGVYAFRKTWMDIPYYKHNDGYVNGDKYQTKFLMGCDLVYNYYIGKRHDINLSAIYNNASKTVSIAVGYRYWINPYVKVKDCTSCGKSWSKGKFRKWWRSIWR